MSYVLSPRARRDIEEIWDYTAKRWGYRQAERYVRQLRAAIEVLAENPALGRPADIVRPGYRRYPCGEHIIFYRGGGEINVVRILHRRMDPDVDGRF